MASTEPAAAIAPMAHAATLVSNLGDLDSMLQSLCSVKELAVDCEGLNLSRTGKLCLLAFSLPSDGGVFLVDVSALSKDAFEHSVQLEGGALLSIRILLESPDVCKLFYDVRNDSDALHHQYGIRLEGVYDLQVAEVAVRRRRGLVVRYVKALEAALKEGLTQQHLTTLHAAGMSKDAMHKLWVEQPNFWDQRPLSQEHILYAANDVCYLHHLLRRFKLLLLPQDHAMILAQSAKRVMEYDQAVAAIQGPHRTAAPAFVLS